MFLTAILQKERTVGNNILCPRHQAVTFLSYLHKTLKLRLGDRFLGNLNRLL
jgi:hypothetical protein